MAVAEETVVFQRVASSLWTHRLVVFTGWVVGTYLLTMLAWVLIPTIFLGWSPFVVVSGSMEPLIKAGDIVVVEAVDHMVGPGTVVALNDGHGVLIHRVVDVAEEAIYTTKGDANPLPDSSEVHQSQVIGQGRLLVPYLGLARVAGWGWWTALGLLVAVSLPLWRRGSGAALVLVVVLMAAVGAASAVAVFTQITAAASSWITAVGVEPPTNLNAACGAIGAGAVSVDLTWTSSPTPGLTGYRILHDGPDAGADFTEVGTTGSGATAFTHTIPVAVLVTGIHSYIVQGVVDPWISENSNTDAVSITQVIVYTCTAQ